MGVSVDHSRPVLRPVRVGRFTLLVHVAAGLLTLGDAASVTSGQVVVFFAGVTRAALEQMATLLQLSDAATD